MKKLALLTIFGLLGTFTLASNEIVEETTTKEIVENRMEIINGVEVTYIVDDENCGCENSPDGTCTVTLIKNGKVVVYGPYDNMSYQACVDLYNQIASENGFNPL